MAVRRTAGAIAAYTQLTGAATDSSAHGPIPRYFKGSGDGSLVVAAETFGIRQLFTLDSDFDVYRMRGKEAFDVVGLL